MRLLSISHLSKSYGASVALQDASLELKAGETLALMGENGAGKSTLIKILAGAVVPDGGEIRLGDEPAIIRSPARAHRLGLRFIHQELNIVPGLSVAENMFLGRDYPQRFGLVDWRTLNRSARAALEPLGIDHIAPETSVSRLSVGDRMLMKIAGAFLEDEAAPARIFVMDEPTAALNGEESRRLHRLIDALRTRGCGIIYVSHRLDEVLAIADTISILRDGATRATLPANEATHARLIELMTGRDAKQAESGTAMSDEAPVVLSVRNLGGRGVSGLSFDLKAGEILGVVGLADAGAEEVTTLLSSGAAEGEVRLNGAPLALRGPYDAWENGIALAPRERRAEGLFLDDDIADNISLPHLARHNRLGLFLDRPAQYRRAQALGQKVRLRATGPGQKVRELSGGNQQKVIFARAVSGNPRVLLLDEPTRGVDVGAKFDIYALLRDLAASGTGIVAVSSDHEEILHLCSRVIVMRAGRLAAIAPAAELTPRRLLEMCYGGPAE